MPHILMLLAGCGHQDGSEIGETFSAMISLSQLGFRLSFASLNENQSVTKNHLTSKQLSETRNQLVESARIVRGNVKELSELNLQEFDGLVLPGGYGVAYNFCNYALSGRNMEIHPHIANCIKTFHESKKPIGSICISPILVGKVLGSHKVTLTLGAKSQASEDLESFGSIHKICHKSQCVIDEVNLLVSTPAYMYADSTLAEIYDGIHALGNEMVRLTKK